MMWGSASFVLMAFWVFSRVSTPLVEDPGAMPYVVP